MRKISDDWLLTAAQIAATLIGLLLVGVFFYLEAGFRRVTSAGPQAWSFLRATTKLIVLLFSMVLGLSLGIIALDPVWLTVLFVALSAAIVVLRIHRTRQPEERLAWGGAYEDHGLVFSRENGEPLHPDRLVDAFKRIAKLAGLSPIRFHDLRHTHATHLLQAAVHPKIVSDRLGHATVAMTLETYSHVVPSLGRDAAEKAEGLVFG